MRNIALILTYLGTAYHGWQVQKRDITVGQTLEQATARVVGHPVANFHTTSGIPTDRLPYALNTHLPEDIVITGAMEVHDGFNAIGSCVRKEYTYLIYNSRIRDPFYVNRAWFYPKRLDETVMQRAASQFVGTHDFAAVRSVCAPTASSITWRAPWRGPWSIVRKGKLRRRTSAGFWPAVTGRLPGRPCRPAACI